MADQVRLNAHTRTEQGKGPTKRLRKQGRVPGIVYGYKVDPTSVDVDALELFHTLHTDAGHNVLIRLEVEGETHLTVARDMQWHPVKGETLHVDFLAVDRDSQISVEVPVHLTDEEETESDGGVTNHILYAVPILVRPLDVPNSFDLSVEGMGINDVKRVEDLVDQLPEGAEFDIDLDRTVVTINAPISEEELEELEADAGVEAEEPELVGEDTVEDIEIEPGDEGSDDESS